MRLRLYLLAATLALGCAAESEYFRPTEPVTTVRDGETAAAYEVRDGQGRRLGEVSVWSEGAQEREVRGRKMALVTVGLEVENTSNQPLQLDLSELQLMGLRAGDREAPSATLLSITSPSGGTTVVPPASVKDFELVFAVSGVDARDLDSFRLRWGLHIEGQRYRQFTAFTEDTSRREAYAYGYPFTPYGYYDPFYGPFPYDPFGPSIVFLHERVPVRRVVKVPPARRRF